MRGEEAGSPGKDAFAGTPVHIHPPSGMVNRYNKPLMQLDPKAAPDDPSERRAPAPEDSSQPLVETRVEKDMSALAIHPGMLPGNPDTRDFDAGDPDDKELGSRNVAGSLPVVGQKASFSAAGGFPAPVDTSPEGLRRRADAVARGSYAELTDAEVMLELKAGNMAAFDVLLAKYRKPIIHFMFRMVHNQAVAEELAQEVFLRVYRSRETYRAEARFSTWLYRIATNLGVNHARDHRYERAAQTVHLDEPDADTGTTPDLADDRPTAESRLLRDERMNAIREHVMALPERQRTAVLLHKYEGLDYKGIGEVLKLSESATKSLLFRAYQTLREKLKGFL